MGNSRLAFDTQSDVANPVQVDDYYAFGMEINTRSVYPKNEYLYNKKELQEELGQYDYGARFYDPVIARWTTIDPKVEDNHHEWTPYAYVYDDPIRLMDPDGRDSAQRAKAKINADKIVQANPEKNKYCYDPKGKGKTGAKGTKPGEAMDCSGFEANNRKAGGEPNPVGTKKGVDAAEAKFGKGKTNGVRQLAATAEPVDICHPQVGNEVYFGNYTHVGIVTSVTDDKNGNAVSITFEASNTSTGPTIGTATLDFKGYWGKKIDSFGKWDTKPDKSDDDK